ncbi:MAG: AAA family ATPase, partial [Raoultibacter sp.]
MSHATVYAIANSKGGAGKTTTATCLVESWHRAKKKALLIDLDQQCNATTQFGAQVENHTTAYDLLTDVSCNPLDAIQHTDHGDIIAGDLYLANLESEMASATCRETRLADALDKIKSSYDRIVIDCSPFLGIATTNALVAADEVIIPIDCEKYAVDGCMNTVNLATQIMGNKRLNPDLRIGGLLLTKYHADWVLDRSYASQLSLLAEAHGTK